MSLTGKDIAEIAKLLDASPFSSLDLQQGDFRLRIRRDGAGDNRRSREVDADWAHDGDDGDDGDDGQIMVEPVARAHPSAAAAQANNGPEPGEIDIPAPLLGNFYTAPRPGEDPFVNVGDQIGEDTIVGIIEVMKLMNSVRAGVAGTLVAVLAENGTAVAEGQPLFRIRAD